MLRFGFSIFAAVFALAMSSTSCLAQTVEGKLTADGKTVKLAYGHAFRERGEICIVLSDVSLSLSDSKDWTVLKEKATSGKARALRFTVIMDSGKALIGSTEIYHPDAGFNGLNVSGQDEFEPQKVGAKSVEGKIFVSKPYNNIKGRLIEYEAKFKLPIEP
jgi:hypothetical protein